MFWRYIILLLLSLILTLGCNPDNSVSGKLSIGAINFGDTNRSQAQYSELISYLGRKLNNFIEFESTFNEIKAIEQIKAQKWDLVFAPPGIAAIAVSEYNYLPIFSLEAGENTRSVIIVVKNSPIEELKELEGKIIALGQVGSLTGYYLPVYNLYGLMLAEIRFAPTPETSLKWIATGEVVAGAMSLEEFYNYRSNFADTEFRILTQDIHQVPSGAILLGSTVDRNQQEMIVKALTQAPPNVVGSARYIINAPVPEYDYLSKVISRVNKISQGIKEKPVFLYETDLSN